MLIEFRVENHKSLLTEQVFTLEASSLSDEGYAPTKIDGYDTSILPAAAIYGPNASGKSNLLSAMAFMRHAVVFSHRTWEPEGGVQRSPFAWAEGRNLPSAYEVTFMHQDVKYEFGFSVDDEKVIEEWLYAWPNNRKQVWFERSGSEFKFGENLRGPNKFVEEVTRPNSLFLSAAAQQNHSQLTTIYTWFKNIQQWNVSKPEYYQSGRSAFYRGMISKSEEQRFLSGLGMDPGSHLKNIRQLFVAADVGIVDMKRVDIEEEFGDKKFKSSRFYFQHCADDEDSWLGLGDESDGTRTLFQMAPSLYRALESGGLLLVDELESSLHPLLGLLILKLFGSKKNNPNNAQIVFTTHDTNLLGSMPDMSPLRRDQIWFTEKDKKGASLLYPLTDFRPRKVENIERGYLQGRYGAIPFLGELFNDSDDAQDE